MKEEKLYQKAGRNIARALEKDKEYYNTKHSDPCSFTKGTIVWIRNNARGQKGRQAECTLAWTLCD